MEVLEHYESCFSEVYDRKPVATDPRLGDFVRGPHAKTPVKTDSQTLKWAIVGHADDDGIALGNGRRGAAGGPNAIRKHLLKMTPHLFFSKTNASGEELGFQLSDFGNLRNQNLDLAARHQVAIQQQTLLYAEGYKVLALGGGHDYGYADAAAFLNACGLSTGSTAKSFAGMKPLVLNIDAHLDVRPSEAGFSSGTPFYRLVSEFGANFEMMEIGIQSQCNSKTHWNWAIERDVKILSYDEMVMSGQDQSVVMGQFLAEKLTSKKRPVFLSVDMDAFEAPFGSGCSAPATVGLKADEFLKFLATLASRTTICGVGLYEASPALDRDEMTSRFAARIAFEAFARA